MSGFTDVEIVEVPFAVVDEVQEFLRFMGKRGTEGFGLWVGRQEGVIFRVTEAVIPDQTGHVTEDGVCVTVGPDELHRINVDLFKRKVKIIAQIHSHPGDAYHSQTDDLFAIATTAGCLSLVVPDFARYSFSLKTCAGYRLGENGIWQHISDERLRRLVILTE